MARRPAPSVSGGAQPVQTLGWAQKKGGFVKNWKRRHFVIVGYHLRYFTLEGIGLRGSADLSQATKIERIGTPMGEVISITTPERVWEIRNIEGDATQWFAIISAACPRAR
jgi:hypothetical protein